MQELNMAEVQQVSGGFLPLLVIATIILTGCGGPADDKENKNKKKIDDEIERSGG
ncbi:hypothetical protein UNDYM_5714 [Undibacterium sp. YM2]|uniref:class IIb bacteriocin, lactobin A/cerein 7B family n=1 Tax=Undibacterium sp. YM2 TaxID=2058625 RepID=UPI001331F995|nr:class IIb bacteriocin, lactobin A/cerein 7B family [Undibacterium sp. YM2]BBB69967.1 hypothetical protein UNDYM_5714 [Undibacterium sp. YM2]